MRTATYSLYMDLFVFGRYLAFVAGATLLFSAVTGVLLCLLMLWRPLPVVRPYLTTGSQSPPQNLTVSQPAPAHSTLTASQRAAAALVQLTSRSVEAVPILLAVTAGLVMRAPRSSRSTGPPARGTIPGVFALFSPTLEGAP
jgi:hypothetical protein